MIFGGVDSRTAVDRYTVACRDRLSTVIEVDNTQF